MLPKAGKLLRKIHSRISESTGLLKKRRMHKILAKSTKNNSVSIKYYCKLEFQQARSFQSWMQAQCIPPPRSGLPFSLTGGKRYEQKGVSPARRRHKFPDINWSCLRPDHCLSHTPQPHWAAREKKRK